jgi:hypothetical protein
VPEPEPGRGERGAGVHRALEQPTAGVQVVGCVDDAREPLADQLRTRERLTVAFLVPPLDVQRLGGVRQGVHRRADRFRPRQADGELGLVDDPGKRRAEASSLHPPVVIADPEAWSPLRA